MNNIFVRSKNSIATISLNRIMALLPFLVIGLYINVYLAKDYSINNILHMLSYPFIGLLIGIIVNFIFTKKQKKDHLSDILFSSFHIEYGLILGFLMSNSVSLIVFSISLLVMFIISKLVDIKINIVAVTFLIIYICMSLNGGFELTLREVLTEKDYIIGNVNGGNFSTGLLSLLISIFILRLKNFTKMDISIYAIFSYIALCLLYSFITDKDLLMLVFLNSYLFIFTFVASDSISSSYTLNGVKIYGLLVGILTFILSFKLSILAPFISIIVASFFSTFIDNLTHKIGKKN